MSKYSPRQSTIRGGAGEGVKVGVRVGGMGEGVDVAVGGTGVAVGGTGVAVGGAGVAVNVAVGGMGVGVKVGGGPTCVPVAVGVAVKVGVSVGVSVWVGVAVSSLAIGVPVTGVGVAAGAQAARSRRTARSKNRGGDNLIRFMAVLQSSEVLLEIPEGYAGARQHPIPCPISGMPVGTGRSGILFKMQIMWHNIVRAVRHRRLRRYVISIAQNSLARKSQIPFLGIKGRCLDTGSWSTASFIAEFDFCSDLV